MAASTAGPSSSDAAAKAYRKSILYTLFISLLLDLLSFTLILPLFPRLLAFYRSTHSPLLDTIFAHLNTFKSTFHRPINPRFDVVLLGGALGSLFSLLQAIASPIIGALSDRYGRRTALLFSMAGNLLSVALWVAATSFGGFLASRIVGGLTEGNVQLAIAIASDVSDGAKERTATLALVGAAFSIAFTVGPMIGAYMSSKVLSDENPFMTAALFSLALIAAETVFIWFRLPETRPLEKKRAPGEKLPAPEIVDARGLKMLNLTHFLFLLIFSGMEFSLSFMTYDLFSYSSAQNGRLLAFIGLLSSLLQGGYVRRKPPAYIAKIGLMACTGAFFLLSRVHTERQLYVAAVLLAVTSACVVTGLTALASLRVGEKERGRELGGFRSAGQAGRAMGPVLFSSLYWWAGRDAAYLSGGAAMAMVVAISWRSLTAPREKVKAK